MSDPHSRDTRPVHFMGIAGAGMSALAELFVRRGYRVSGCDTNLATADDLRRLGIDLFEGHDPSHVADASEIIMTSAVRKDHPELERMLRPGGALVAVEPYWSPMAKVMYKHMHPEPFNERADRWEFESTGPMMSNQAMSYLLLERDRAMFEREFPALEVIELGAFGGPSYLLTGGIWKQKLLPDRALARLWDFEDSHSFWKRFLALHHLFVLQRR